MERRHDRPREEVRAHAARGRPRPLACLPSPCALPSSRTSTPIFTHWRRCSPTLRRRRSTRSGASATSSATARGRTSAARSSASTRRSRSAATTISPPRLARRRRVQRRRRSRRALDRLACSEPAHRDWLGWPVARRRARRRRAVPRQPSRPDLGVRPHRAGGAALPARDRGAARARRTQPRRARRLLGRDARSRAGSRPAARRSI